MNLQTLLDKLPEDKKIILCQSLASPVGSALCELFTKQQEEIERDIVELLPSSSDYQQKQLLNHQRKDDIADILTFILNYQED